jgi:hypothetical protein
MVVHGASTYVVVIMELVQKKVWDLVLDLPSIIVCDLERVPSFKVAGFLHFFYCSLSVCVCGPLQQ